MKTLIIFPLCLAIAACVIQSATVPLSPEAEKLLVVDSTENCRIINVVVGSHDIGKEIGQNVKYALNDAKNKAAKLGADSIRIVGSKDVSSRVAMSSRSNSVIVEALDCK